MPDLMMIIFISTYHQVMLIEAALLCMIHTMRLCMIMNNINHFKIITFKLDQNKRQEYVRNDGLDSLDSAVMVISVLVWEVMTMAMVVMVHMVEIIMDLGVLIMDPAGLIMDLVVHIMHPVVLIMDPEVIIMDLEVPTKVPLTRGEVIRTDTMLGRVMEQHSMEHIMINITPRLGHQGAQMPTMRGPVIDMLYTK